ncbi:MAG: IbrB-like domain-containing protein [Cyclobacteriaceae bacterium]
MAHRLADAINEINDFEQKVDALNEARKILSRKSSPFVFEPVDCVLWVYNSRIKANEYNPNKVVTPEMELLYESIKQDGFTMPIVTFPNADHHEYEIVDGFHRSITGTKRKDIKKRVHGYLPASIVNKDLKDRMASTVRHNRARGKHEVNLMGVMIEKLTSMGMDNVQIAKNLGMQPEEILRLKQQQGIAEFYKHREYSRAWKWVDDDDVNNLGDDIDEQLNGDLL